MKYAQGFKLTLINDFDINITIMNNTLFSVL